MKRIYRYISALASGLLAFGLLASLSGCRKAEGDVTPVEGKYEMGFLASDVQSKAGYNTEDIATDGNSFKVYAYYTTDSENKYNASDASFQSFTETVTYDADATSDNKWISAGEHYWESGAYYKFRAYFPGDFPATITDVAASTPSFKGYTIESLPEDQVDVLLAETTRAYDEIFTLGTTVPFTFKHLLSKIYLKVQMSDQLVTDGFTSRILGAGFRNVTRTADYSGAVWTGHTGKSDIVMDFGTAKELTPTNNLVTLFDDGFLVIPQQVTAGVVTAYINAVLPIGNSGNTIERPIEIILPASSPAWEAGRQYTYTATITADYNIEFSTPTIADWEGGSTSGTVVIR